MDIIWKGVFPALLSPFDAENKIDVGMLEHSVHFQIASGVSGLIVGGSLGEASTLTKDEKTVLTRETLKCVGNKSIPVIVNIAEASTQDAIEAVRQAENDGANGLMILPPMRYKADPKETIQYFLTIAHSTDLPIMIYNNPVDYGIEISIEMFEKLLAKKNIVAVKESTRDTSNIHRLKETFGSRLKILSGVDTLAFESLVLGADGWVAGLVNAFPVETVQIFNFIQDGRLEEARKINTWFFPLLELDITPKLVQNIKLAAARLGLSTPHMRPPRMPLVGKELEGVNQIIDNCLSKRPKL